ncbi:uncharacterized protein LOC115904036 [Camarhynchus parvulus]|uniref:uncharacterized protein LOC115904036 n=1 Tax=Geospiza parvula TaxID=87175 RepID=UPI001237C52C|nr:uncharacterized protein LOC115904036 [Camarhynchus parvulus]
MAEPPGAAGRDGAGRGARPGGSGAGAAGGRGVPLGQGQRQPGRSDARRALHFPRLFFFLSRQPALPPRPGEQPPRWPKVPGAAGRSPGGTAARPAVPAHTGVSFFLKGKQPPAPGQACLRLRGHKVINVGEISACSKSAAKLCLQWDKGLTDKSELQKNVIGKLGRQKQVVLPTLRNMDRLILYTTDRG